MDKLTLDTNVVQEHWKRRSKRNVVEQLVALAEIGEVELAVTRYVRSDVPREPLAARIDQLGDELKVMETGGVFTLGTSTLGGPDRLGSQQFLDFIQSPVGWRPKKGRPPDGRDLMHLHAHLTQGRTAFLTWDEGVVEFGEHLAKAGFRIHVVRPEEYLTQRPRSS